MRIGVYMEHGVGNGVGGAELMMAYLASVWSRQHDVDLIHHRPPLTRERLSLFSTDDYSRIDIQAVPREPEPEPSRNLAARYRAARAWQASLSAPYDLFVNCTHWRPCFSHARRSVLLVMFPFYVPEWRQPAGRSIPGWKRLLHQTYYDFEWRRRLASYDRHLAISDYSARWTRHRWGLETDIVHPPVDVDFPSGPKDDLIASVGRFSTMAHTKKQLEMVQAFVSMQAEGLRGWQYACVGGLNAREENHRYFERVRAEGAPAPVHVEANVSRARVRDLLSRARVFWHATGLGEDDEHPELAEHFGIATVEAMAAGCVPVVIDRGGQSEIVTDGVDGFLWSTLDEMKRCTRRLIDDPALWARLSAAARVRARDFARSRFVERMSRACGIDVPTEHTAPAQGLAPAPVVGHSGQP